MKASSSEELRRFYALEILEDRLGLFLWDWHPSTGDLFLGEGFFALLGYAPGELSPTERTWTGLIHPEDRRTVVQAREAAAA